MEPRSPLVHIAATLCTRLNRVDDTAPSIVRPTQYLSSVTGLFRRHGLRNLSGLGFNRRGGLGLRHYGRRCLHGGNTVSAIGIQLIVAVKARAGHIRYRGARGDGLQTGIRNEAFAPCYCLTEHHVGLIYTSVMVMGGAHVENSNRVVRISLVILGKIHLGRRPVAGNDIVKASFPNSVGATASSEQAHG